MFSFWTHLLEWFGVAFRKTFSLSVSRSAASPLCYTCERAKLVFYGRTYDFVFFSTRLQVAQINRTPLSSAMTSLEVKLWRHLNSEVTWSLLHCRCRPLKVISTPENVAHQDDIAFLKFHFPQNFNFCDLIFFDIFCHSWIFQEVDSGDYEIVLPAVYLFATCFAERNWKFMLKSLIQKNPKFA